MLRRASSKSRMILNVLLILAGIYLVVCVVAYFIQEKLFVFPEVLPATFQYEFSGSFTEVSLETDGAVLSALHFRTEHPKGVILYLHGNSGSLRHWGNVGRDFALRGYDSLILDYRGFGKSTGHLTNERALLSDVTVAYDYLAKHYPETQIIVFGRSLGSGPAVYLAQHRKPGLLLLETPYASFTDLMRLHTPYLPTLLLKYPLRSDQWIGSVTCPVYLFHGTKDTLIPYSESQKLLPLIKTKHELFTIEGGSHNDLKRFPEYQKGLNAALNSDWQTKTP